MPKTGATRYQKFLKSEKSKTKLKSKKELPKGTNVTKTTFKVKKIVLREQLRTHDETEALSTRKLNIKELVSRLNHFNTRTRIDALNGLKELITIHPELVDQNLGQLVNAVTPLVLNVEKSVRGESLKVQHVILKHIAPEKIEPFFDIMSTYLRSAMTHIDNRIQEDSLLFLDILLIFTPKKVAQHFYKIIPNFLDMISKLRVDAKPGRALTINLVSQMTTVKWRVKVLHRLKGFLQKFIEHNNIHSMDKFSFNTTHIFAENKFNNYPLFNPIYTLVCPLSCFSSKNMHDSVELNGVEKFTQYRENLMPLLFETWLEVCPNVNRNKNIETVISEDAAILLKHTLEVISSLWELVQYFDEQNPNTKIKMLYCQKYNQAYNQNFVHAFPYVTNIRSKHVKTNDSIFEDTVTDAKLVAENLQICYLFIIFHPFVNVKSNNREIAAILNYVEKTFNQDSDDNINDAVIKILHAIFSNEVTSWTKSLLVMDALFRKIIWAYFNKDMPNGFKQKIFSLLCKIALNGKLGHFHSSEAFEKWLHNLPDILLEDSVNMKTVNIFHKFAVQSNNTFNVVIKPKMLKIIEKLPTLIISDSSDNTSYFKLFSVLYWVKNWDIDSLNLLEQQLLNNVYKNEHSKYIFDTLRLRSGVTL